IEVLRGRDAYVEGSAGALFNEPASWRAEIILEVPSGAHVMEEATKLVREMAAAAEVPVDAVDVTNVYEWPIGLPVI
ncbi:MAG TPA: hypothetical protein VIG64_00720, partial [Actinomycetota bacterium]